MYKISDARTGYTTNNTLNDYTHLLIMQILHVKVKAQALLLWIMTV